MKRLLLAAASGLFIFLFSCNHLNGDNGSTGSGDSTNSQGAKNLAVNRDILKAIETGDSSRLSASLASDGIDHMGPNGREIRSGDSIKWYLADIHNHFSDLKINVLSDAAQGDYVFTWSEMTGSAKDNTQGMPAGTKFDMKSVDVVKFKDGKAYEHWGYVDPADMMKMMNGPGMGTMPPPGGNKMSSKDTARKK